MPFQEFESLEYREKRKEKFDIEDLSYAGIYSLGLTILNLIDNDAAQSIAKSILNNEFDSRNKSFETLLKDKANYPASIYFADRMVNYEPYRRPSLKLLELSLGNIVKLMVTKYILFLS